MLTNLPVHMFSADSPTQPAASGRRRSAALQLAAVLAGLLWLPAGVAAFGTALGGAALPGQPEGWAYLALGGLPLALAWVALGPSRPPALRTAFPVLAALAVVGCLLAAAAGPAGQAGVALAVGLPVWLLFLVPRRGRRSTVCVENTVWRVGTVTW